MRESSFHTRIEKWIKSQKKTGAWELKYTKTDRIPFKNIRSIQEQSLSQAKHGIFVKKISDFGGAQSGKKDFDFFSLFKSYSFIIIIYQQKRGQRTFAIDIDAILKEKYSSEEKSLHIKRASVIGDEIMI